MPRLLPSATEEQMRIMLMGSIVDKSRAIDWWEITLCVMVAVITFIALWTLFS